MFCLVVLCDLASTFTNISAPGPKNVLHILLHSSATSIRINQKLIPIIDKFFILFAHLSYADVLINTVKSAILPFEASFFIFQTASTNSKFSVAYSFSRYALKWSCPIGSFNISQQLKDQRLTRRSATCSRAHTVYISHSSVESVIQGFGGSGATKKASYS